VSYFSYQESMNHLKLFTFHVDFSNFCKFYQSIAEAGTSLQGVLLACLQTVREYVCRMRTPIDWYNKVLYPADSGGACSRIVCSSFSCLISAVWPERGRRACCPGCRGRAFVQTCWGSWPGSVIWDDASCQFRTCLPSIRKWCWYSCVFLAFGEFW